MVFEDVVVVLCDGMGGCCERRGRKSTAKRQASKCRKQRQADAKLCLAVQHGSREAREDLIVARRRVRMGMGRSGRSLRGHPAYTDPFPGTLRKLVILVEPCSLRCGIPACTSTAARVFMARGSSPWHKHCWRALSMSRRHSASHWRRPYQPGAPTKTPQGYVAQQAAYQSTRRCLPQGRSEQARRGGIASSWADCTTIASFSRRSERHRQRCIANSYAIVLRCFFLTTLP